MKILYISNYRDGTGWGIAALHYMLAMDSVGIEIVPELIQYNNRNLEPPERIKELEKNSRKNCDIVIQHCLPSDYEYCGHFKRNIGVYFTETSCIKNIGWINKINLMDEVWCCNPQMIEAAKISGITVPTELVPIPCNPSKYIDYYEPLNIPEIKDTFVFYTISDTSKRKNLPALIKAFHLEFLPYEPVSLLIKSTSEQRGAEQVGQQLNEMISVIKQGMKLYRNLNDYKQEIIISQYLDDKDLMRLHKTCDCFVSTSYGESWNEPAFDAMGMGKTPIITNVGGPKYFIICGNDNEAGWLIPYSETPCFGMVESGPDIYTSRENWYDISITELRKAMREAYLDKELRLQQAKLGVQRVRDFSYEKIGKQIKDNLCKFCQ